MGSSDYEKQVEISLYQSLPYYIGPGGARKMTYFTFIDLERIQYITNPVVSATWNVGRKKRFTYPSMDVWFPTLTIYEKRDARKFF